MIARLAGRCLHVEEDTLVVDVGGVGYLVRATTSVLQRAASSPDDTVVFIHTHVRDDAIQLFGFGSVVEQRVFERLLTLQGVGPRLALAILSACSPADLHRAAATEDVALLQSVPGVGPKVARRIVTELRDKLADVVPTVTLGAQIERGESFHDARDALMGLGMSLGEAETALRETDPQAATEQRIREALSAVGGARGVRA